MAGPRIKPSFRGALILIVLYSITVVVVAASTGTNYADWFETSENIWNTPVPMLYAGWVVILCFLAYARWGSSVFRDPERLPMPRVLWIPVGVMVVGVILRLIAAPWGDMSASFFLGVLVTGIGVGFAEETVFRGAAIGGLRNGLRPEFQVALYSSAAFGMFHLTNLAFGSPLANVLGQVVMAGLSGVTFYLLRRGTGSIVPAMVLHGVFDMSLFFYAGGTPDSTIGQVGYAVPFLSYLLSVWTLWWLYRHDRQTVVRLVDSTQEA